MSKLNDVKEGDEVTIHKTHHKPRLAKVKRTTATQVVVMETNPMGMTYEQRFLKSNGNLVGSGSGYSRTWIDITDDSDRQTIRVANLAGFISKRIELIQAHIHRMSEGELSELAAALKPYPLQDKSKC